MRFPLILLCVLFLCNIGVDVYLWLALRSYCRDKLWSKVQAWGSVALTAMLVAVIACSIVRTPQSITFTFYALYAYLSIYIVKYLTLVFDALSRVSMLFKRKRVKALTWIGLGLGIVVFILMWWGALVNRYRVDIEEQTVEIADLPKAFEGYRIVQLSDIHTGSWGNDTVFISRVVDKVNSLNPDLILFTGDIVNMNSNELKPFVPVLSRLHAPDGVWSVLGNHDYGDYSIWRDPVLKEADHRQLLEQEAKMGWHMLNNAHADIVHDGDTIVLVGVENIGDPPFHTYGDLAEAYPTPSDSRVKILMSHNPAHWERDIANCDTMNFALTLAGHTHAMQVELFGLSPAAWRYDKWGGMYVDSLGRRLYVNIGVGTVGIPARIGATPEITLFTLTR